jgi:four helix bundle protein
MRLHSFKDLDVWRLSREIRINISNIVKSFPVHEKYNLTSQLIRSSRSITANIAEGFGRYYYKENILFCRQARGSLYETLDHLICALDEKYISQEILDSMQEKLEKCLKSLNGYISYLKRQVINNQ